MSVSELACVPVPYAPTTAHRMSVIVIDGGAHCSDMDARISYDTPAMIEARNKAAAIISAWVSDARVAADTVGND